MLVKQKCLNNFLSKILAIISKVKTTLLGENMRNFSVLPQIDKILRHEKFKDFNKGILTFIARNTLDNLRKNENFTNQDEILTLIENEYKKFNKTSLQKLINATGIVIHTNLGRSVLDAEIWDNVKEFACGYCNLEYDLEKGARGNRYDYSAFLLSALFGCEDALVVNNNAAAVFLVLNTFVKGAKTIVSRGELVEIGGSFRIPDVMSESGTELKEVGTTNKTRLDDYENAIDESVKMLLKVHKSNYEITGFTSEVSINEIALLARDKGILSYYDLGGGAVLNLKSMGNEKCVAEVLKSGVDLLSFSGDKLFGSIQAGIILGPHELISKLRKNQLLRMLRSDKITLALLCESIKAYLEKNYARIPTIWALERSVDELKILANNLNSKISNKAQIISTSTFAGGGTLPNRKIASVALAFSGNPKALEAKFRSKNVIGRIENEKFLLDLRSVLPSDENAIIEAIKGVFDE